MNRRWFLGVSAASALAGLTGSARGASANAAVDVLTLAQPDLLPLIGPQAVRKIGLRYRALVPNENDVQDRKSTRLNSSHGYISYAVFCLKKKKKKITTIRLSSI